MTVGVSVYNVLPRLRVRVRTTRGEENKGSRFTTTHLIGLYHHLNNTCIACHVLKHFKNLKI